VMHLDVTIHEAAESSRRRYEALDAYVERRRTQ